MRDASHDILNIPVRASTPCRTDALAIEGCAGRWPGLWLRPSWGWNLKHRLWLVDSRGKPSRLVSADAYGDKHLVGSWLVGRRLAMERSALALARLPVRR
jgi:hypothetical protein